jgi:hypothetical protein
MRTSYGLVPVALLVATAGAVCAQTPPAALAPSGKVALTADFKMIEGEIAVGDAAVAVRHGSLTKTLPRPLVLFVGGSKADVYRFRLSKLDAADKAGRLALARWCGFNGMRAEALAEARAVLQAEPTHRAAADMARALESSLKQFPDPNTLAVTPAPPATTPAEPEPDVTPEARVAFGNRVQPVLVNLCVECHGRPDHAGAFKLARTSAADAGPVVTRHNLRAALGQLRKDDPSASPLLVKALSAHGGMPTPLFGTRQGPAYRTLEWWVYAVVAPTVLPPMDAAPQVAKLPAAPAPAAPLEVSAVPAGGAQPAPAVKPALPPAAATGGPLNADEIPTGSPKPVLPPAKLPAVGGAFGVDAKPAAPDVPNPSGAGPAVDEFDPAVFNRAMRGPRPMK